MLDEGHCDGREMGRRIEVAGSLGSESTAGFGRRKATLKI